MNDQDRSAFEPWEDHHRCQALSKQTRQQCGRAASVGKQTCKFHGGSPNQPQGVAHKAYKTGLFSSSLPKRLQSRLEAAAEDPDMIGLHNELALIRVRLAGLLEQFEEGDNPERWGKARDAFALYHDLCQAGEAHCEEAAEAARVLSETFSAGINEHRLWEDVYRALAVKVKLSDSHTKRLSAANQMYSHNEVSSLLVSILNTVDSLVSDPSTKAKINTSISRTINITADDYQAA